MNKVSQELMDLAQVIAEHEADIEVDCAARDRLVARIRSKRQAVAELQGQQGLLQAKALAGTEWSELLNTQTHAARAALTKALSNKGFLTGGEWVETGQTAIRIKLTNGRPCEVARACLVIRELLPHITPHPDGIKWFGVFEHTLSAGASYHACIGETARKFTLQARRGHRDRTLFEADTLESLVQYIHDRHYYDVFQFPEDVNEFD